MNEWKSVIEKLKSIKDTFNICLTGGEPIYHPNIVEIVDGIAECNVGNIYLFTNFSHGVESYKKINNSSLCYKISYHPEYDKKFKKKKLLELKEANIRFEVVVMVNDRKYIEETTELFKFLVENDISYNFSLLRKTNSYHPIYIPKVIESYKKFVRNEDEDSLLVTYDDDTKEIIHIRDFQKNNFKGFICESRLFEIDNDGTFTHACTRGKTIDTDVICPNEECDSDMKLEYKKRKER